MIALRAGPPQTVTFCAAHKNRQFSPAMLRRYTKSKSIIMTINCWICEKEEATTGEHAIMKAAYERILGKIKKGDNAFFSYVGGKKNIPIGSFKNDRLKFDKSICQACNGALTQAYDNEFISLIEKLLQSKHFIISRNRLSLNSFNKPNLALYFIKIFGCLIKELNGNVAAADHELIRQSILQGKVLTNNIHISAHRNLGKLAAKATKTISTYPVFEADFCSWIIDLDWISFIICYPFAPMQEEYGTQWNLNTDITSLSIGKLK